jgi:hypothetical protein
MTNTPYGEKGTKQRKQRTKTKPRAGSEPKRSVTQMGGRELPVRQLNC